MRWNFHFDIDWKKICRNLPRKKNIEKQRKKTNNNSRMIVSFKFLFNCLRCLSKIKLEGIQCKKLGTHRIHITYSTESAKRKKKWRERKNKKVNHINWCNNFFCARHFIFSTLGLQCYFVRQKAICATAELYIHIAKKAQEFARRKIKTWQNEKPNSAKNTIEPINK